MIYQDYSPREARVQALDRISLDEPELQVFCRTWFTHNRSSAPFTGVARHVPRQVVGRCVLLLDFAKVAGLPIRDFRSLLSRCMVILSLVL